MNTKEIGDMAESMILAALLERGYTVLKPIGDNQRYDLVVDMDGKFLRIQCKTGQIKNGAVEFGYKSSYRGKDGTVQRKYTADEIDYFMVYEPINKRVYVINIDNMVYKLRITEPKKSNPNVKYARDYIFHDFIRSEVVDGKPRKYFVKPDGSWHT